MSADVECDLFSGGGLAAAVTAAFDGLKVTVAKKAPVFGGTTAWVRRLDVGAVQFLGAAGGIGVLDIEFVKITPEIEVDSLEPFLAAGARLGAKYVIASLYDPDLARLADRLAAISDLGSRRRVGRSRGGGAAKLGILAEMLHFNLARAALTAPKSALRMGGDQDQSVSYLMYPDARLILARMGS